MARLQNWRPSFLAPVTLSVDEACLHFMLSMLPFHAEINAFGPLIESTLDRKDKKYSDREHNREYVYFGR